MVRTIVNHIHKNTDHSSLPENILDTMRKNNVGTFREADNVLEQIAARNHSIIPDQLDCVLQLGSGQVGQVGQIVQPGQVPTLMPQSHHAHIFSNKPVTSHSASVFVPSTLHGPTHNLNRTLPVNISSKPVTAHSVPAVIGHNSRLTSHSSALSINGRPLANTNAFRPHPVPSSVVRPLNINSSVRNSITPSASPVMPFRSSNLSGVGVLNKNTVSATKLHSDVKKGTSSGLHFTPTPGKSITPLASDLSKFKSTSVRQGLPTIP